MHIYTWHDCSMNVYFNPAYGCQTTINVYVCMLRKQAVKW